VITHGIVVDLVDGIRPDDGEKFRSFRISQLHYTTKHYRYAQDIFMALDSCLFAGNDYSPDRWMYLASLFAGNYHRNIVKIPILRAWLRAYADFQASGRTVRGWVKSFQLYSESSASIRQINPLGVAKENSMGE
jgi:hypothetical protein